MTKADRDKIISELRRAKDYVAQAQEMLLHERATQFRCNVKTAKDSLDIALATFTNAEDKEQSL